MRLYSPCRDKPHGDHNRHPPKDQKLPQRRVRVRPADAARDLVERARKRQRRRLSGDEHDRRLPGHHFKEALHVPLVQLQVDKKQYRSAHDIVDWKVPEIRPPEHPRHRTDQQHLRRKHRLLHRSPPLLLLRQHPSRPRVGDRRHEHDEKDIDIVRVKIAEDRRIRRKLVDRLVSHIRMIADKPRGIGEPVMVFNAPDPVPDRKDHSVNNIVPVPAESDRKTGKKTAQPLRERRPGTRLALRPGMIRTAIRRPARLRAKTPPPVSTAPVPHHLRRE